MFLPDKLKVNSFKDVRLPKPAKIFAQYGAFAANSSQYSGEVPLVPMSKLDSIRMAENTATYYENQEALSAAQAAEATPMGD